MFRKWLLLSGLAGLVIVLTAFGSPSPNLELMDPGTLATQQGQGHLVIYDLKQEPFAVAENRAGV